MNLPPQLPPEMPPVVEAIRMFELLRLHRVRLAVAGLALPTVLALSSCASIADGLESLTSSEQGSERAESSDFNIEEEGDGDGAKTKNTKANKAESLDDSNSSSTFEELFGGDNSGDSGEEEKSGPEVDEPEAATTKPSPKPTVTPKPRSLPSPEEPSDTPSPSSSPSPKQPTTVKPVEPTTQPPHTHETPSPAETGTEAARVNAAWELYQRSPSEIVYRCIGKRRLFVRSKQGEHFRGLEDERGVNRVRGMWQRLPIIENEWSGKLCADKVISDRERRKIPKYLSQQHESHR